eukprot:TRINITY_DN44013_c0_g1_i2.p1 TRINITY_DN44013_c0_g1~~TRINITY_DN44013_c0_g1_i2.p1  ORF type:complete len:368 (-),score=53.65 TRINITY_DN44013_c0_g1_i2:444-1505(-)
MRKMASPRQRLLLLVTFAVAAWLQAHIAGPCLTLRELTSQRFADNTPAEQYETKHFPDQGVSLPISLDIFERYALYLLPLRAAKPLAHLLSTSQKLQAEANFVKADLINGTWQELTSEVCEALAVSPCPTLYVSPSKDILSWSCLGGSKESSFVVISRGMLDTWTRDEIKAIFAHEVAHIQKSHAAEKLRRRVRVIVAAKHLEDSLAAMARSVSIVSRVAPKLKLLSKSPDAIASKDRVRVAQELKALQAQVGEDTIRACGAICECAVMMILDNCQARECEFDCDEAMLKVVTKAVALSALAKLQCPEDPVPVLAQARKLARDHKSKLMVLDFLKRASHPSLPRRIARLLGDD